MFVICLVSGAYTQHTCALGGVSMWCALGRVNKECELGGIDKSVH